MCVCVCVCVCVVTASREKEGFQADQEREVRLKAREASLDELEIRLQESDRQVRSRVKLSMQNREIAY